METEDFYCDFVLNDKIEVKKLRESLTVVAFYHTNPSHKTHIVVVPKFHIDSLNSLEDFKIIEEIFMVIREIAAELGLKDYRIINNNGKYQDSKHLHFHLISE